MRRLLTPAGLLLAIALAAGCGSSSKTTTHATQAASPAAPTATTIAMHASPIGAVLVDGQGRTLYMFEKDKSGHSACTGACATAWPPVTTTGTPTAGAGVKAAKLAAIPRPDGTRQVVYNGHPLYRFRGDTAAGELKGQNIHAFGADWYVVSPSGEEIDRKLPKAASSSAPSGGAPSMPGGGDASGGY